jgi:aspartate/methionine/tyrosine aminotransferase
VLAPRPYSPYLEEVASFLDQELKTFPLLPGQGWQIDLAGLEKQITPRTRAIFLMSPHLPTGAIQKEETLRQLFKLIKGKNIAVIIDESQADFIFNKANLPLAAVLADSRQLLVTLQTLSNSFALPGLKLSWIRVDGPAAPRNELLTSLELLSDTFLGVNQLTQGIMPELVRHTRRWRRKFRKTVEKNRDILVSKLTKSSRLRFHFPEGGFFAFVEVLPPPPPLAGQAGTKAAAIAPQFASAEDFCVSLLEKTGIYLHPGHYYGQNEGVFFALCFLQSPSTLRSSLRKIVKFLRLLKKTE